MQLTLKLEDTLISIALYFLIFIVYTVNEIIVIKTYISNLLKNTDIEYNNYKTILIHTLKVYVKYFLIFSVITVIWIILGLIIAELYLFSSFDPSYMMDKDFVESVFSDPISKNIILFPIYFIFLLSLFKLQFVEHILLFKQKLENYKIKYLVKESYSIIQKDKLFFYISYFVIHIMCMYLTAIFLKNFFIISFSSGIVEILLFMVYLIKFGEIISEDYNQTKINIAI
jgi:hypothetical protein